MQPYKPTINLLIADDHQLFIDGLSKILQDEKMISSIHSALNGKEAVDKTLQNDIDCVLMDINMPLVNGHDATQLIKKQKPYVKIIIVSMLSDAAIVAKLLRAGADAFIIKNTGKDELLKAIIKVMDGEKYISQELSLDLFNIINRKKENEGNNDHLTPREKEIIKYIADGMTNHEIAEKLFLSYTTVDTHRKNILSKLGLKNTASLVKYAAENKLL